MKDGTNAFPCGRAKTIQILKTEKKIRFQKYPDTCGQGLTFAILKQIGTNFWSFIAQH